MNAEPFAPDASSKAEAHPATASQTDRVLHPRVAAIADAMLDPLPLTLVPADKALAQIAGRLRAATAEAGLSLGDRFCLALAQRDGLPAWTSDQNWKKIADAVEVKVVAIR